MMRSDLSSNGLFDRRPDLGTFLLVPMQPTPNGRLHIGHGSGPYLRADVLARAYRRDGHRVRIITGSDGYENWVELNAALEGVAVGEICERFHHEIGGDLENLGVELDIWVDPTSDEYRASYFSANERMVADLIKSGAVQLEEERILFERPDRAIIGPWLAGNCPYCDANCGGNSCVSCGMHFQPEEVRNPKSRVSNGGLQWQTRHNLFLRPRHHEQILSVMSEVLPHRFKSPALTYMREQRGRLRLSNVGVWGISSKLAPIGSILSNTYFGYALYCGELFARLTGAEAHPFERGSDVVTVGLFGTDNSIAGLVAPHCIASSSELYKAFDHVVVNCMLYFENSKCSTSKRHGIWITEAMEGADLSSDEMRFALARVPLDEKIDSIDAELIERGVNKWREVGIARVKTAQVYAGERWDDPLLNKLRASVVVQNKSLSIESFKLHVALSAFEKWLYDFSVDLTEPSVAVTWLLGVSYLGEPLVPELARTAREIIGLSETPWSGAVAQGPSLSRSVKIESSAPINSLSPFIRRQKENA